jgi:hypothetical protein
MPQVTRTRARIQDDWRYFFIMPWPCQVESLSLALNYYQVPSFKIHFDINSSSSKLSLASCLLPFCLSNAIADCNYIETGSIMKKNKKCQSGNLKEIKLG